MFKDFGQITQALSGQQYISTDEISTVMFLAEGDPAGLLSAGVVYALLSWAWRRRRRRDG